MAPEPSWPMSLFISIVAIVLLLGSGLVFTDRFVLLLFLFAFIGFVATVRFALRLLGHLFMSREERMLKAYRKQLEQASADYLKFYQ